MPLRISPLSATGITLQLQAQQMRLANQECVCLPMTNHKPKQGNLQDGEVRKAPAKHKHIRSSASKCKLSISVNVPLNYLAVAF